MIDEQYRRIVAAVEAEFERNRALHGARIHCGPGCTECCHHVFAITEIEANEIARGVAALPVESRAVLRSRAAQYVERRLVRGDRLACPVLEDGKCSLYEHRPLLCRKFGMPLFNPDKPGRIFACELNFASGEEIHDPDLIQIQTGIHEDWSRLKQQAQPSGSERMTVAHAILRATEPFAAKGVPE